jgi:hypothetical protein
MSVEDGRETYLPARNEALDDQWTLEPKPSGVFIYER